MHSYRILVINPGSTSTKIAVFENEREIMACTLRHSAEALKPYAHVADQFAFRKALILEALQKEGIPLESLQAVIGRGGLVKPIASGVYEVNEALRKDLINPPQGEHASNLGGLIAADIAASLQGAKAYIADPVVVDELDEVARVAGHPLFKRVSIFHALNQKAVARTYAARIGKTYETLDLIVAHLGGGISVGAHHQGRVIDVNDALHGDGPFSPERSGELTAEEVVDVCFSGKYTEKEVRRMLCGNGGMVALLGTNNLIEILERCDRGDARASLIVDAFCYNVAKEIGAMATVLSGHVEAILLTGGIAHSQRICESITRRVSFIAPVERFPGEDEMRALAENALRVLRGEQQPSIYA